MYTIHWAILAENWITNALRNLVNILHAYIARWRKYNSCRQWCTILEFFSSLLTLPFSQPQENPKDRHLNVGLNKWKELHRHSQSYVLKTCISVSGIPYFSSGIEISVISARGKKFEKRKWSLLQPLKLLHANHCIFHKYTKHKHQKNDVILKY